MGPYHCIYQLNQPKAFLFSKLDVLGVTRSQFDQEVVCQPCEFIGLPIQRQQFPPGDPVWG